MTDETDALFQAPLADFVRVRDEIVARRKAAGDKAGAAAVKAARKPSVPAWAANQVVWSAPGDWARLQAAAAALRRGHEAGASPDEIRQASREQREALSACESLAAGFLVAHGHAATPPVVQKAGATLQALAYGTADAKPGRVQEELSPPGFDAFAGLSVGVVPPREGAAGGTPAPAPSRQERPTAEPPASFAAAARRREEERARERRWAARAAAQERAVTAREALDAARTRVERSERRREELERALEAARAEVGEALQALAAAEAEVGAATAALEALREAVGGEG